jgi:hypothetical protein
MRLPFFFALILFFYGIVGRAQTPFTAAWNFESNRNGTSSSGSVSVSAFSLNNINESGFPAGVTGDAASISGWPTGGISNNDFAEFSVTPQGYRFSITSVTFDCNRSAQGPTQLVVRSNQDNFGGNIGSTSVGEGFSNQNYGVSFNDLETEVKFRIYAHSAMSGSGTLRIDNLRINGVVTLVPLPVELLSFKSQVLDNEVKLTWETAWERNAQGFEVQRSSDLRNFTTLSTQPAAGNTRERMAYTFTDVSPIVGTNYYRLRQTDHDGKWAFSKIIAVIFRSEQPALWVVQNPVKERQIRVRLLQIRPEELRLLSVNGQEIPFGYQTISNEDFVLQLSYSTPAGLYFLTAQTQLKRLTERLLVSD